MSDWRQMLARLATNAEERFDELSVRLRQRLATGSSDDTGGARIFPYLGHGTPTQLMLRGRVLEDYGVQVSLDKDSTWKNLLNMYRRLNTREIRDVRVRLGIANYPEIDAVVKTNEEGFYEFQLGLGTPLVSNSLWHDIWLELADHPDPATTRVFSRAMIPTHQSQFGVISDLDDTVLQTDVMHVLRMARNTFLQNASTRLPFAGVAEFYQALHHGGGERAAASGGELNPFFYVSNSIWNLYDLFIDFFELRGIPIGTFLLLDLNLSEAYFNNLRFGIHKLETITRLLGLYPALPFILIGDSGERDPEIYLKAALEYPGRIAAIYIRDVSGSVRDESIVKMIEQANSVGTEMLLVAHSLAAAEHAAARGYITKDALPSIRAGLLRDNRPPAQTETLLLDGQSEPDM